MMHQGLAFNAASTPTSLRSRCATGSDPQQADANALVVTDALPVQRCRSFSPTRGAQPGPHRLRSGGIGSAGHLDRSSCAVAHRTKLTHVPYKGSGRRSPISSAARFQAMLLTHARRDAYVKAAGCGPLPLPAARRSPALPDLPTIAERACRLRIHSPGMECSARQLPKERMRAGSTPRSLERLRPGVRGTRAERSGSAHDDQRTVRRIVRADVARWGKKSSASSGARRMKRRRR